MKVLVTLSYIIWSPLGHRLFFRTGMSCCQWTADLSQKSIEWEDSLRFQQLLKSLLFVYGKEKWPHQKYAMAQLVNIYIPISKPAKAYHCPKLWFTFSRCNSSCQGFLLPSTQNIMLPMPICLFLPHLWDPANLRVLWSSTCDQKATKLTQRTEQVL